MFLRSCINPTPQEQPASTIASVQDVNFGDYALESVNTDQVLSEIIQDANQQKCVQSLSNSNVNTFCDPQFHSVGQMHIHYHMSSDSIETIKNDFLLVIVTFHKLQKQYILNFCLFLVNLLL